MGNKGSGIDPREMVNAPIKGGNGVAGNGMSDAVQDAIISNMLMEQSKTLDSSIMGLFGEPTFRLPDREGVYTNDRNPGIVSRKMAQVVIAVGSALVLETTIYASEKVVKDASGSFMECSYSVSLPRGLSAPKDDPSAQRQLSMWKQSVLDKYDTWIARLDASMPVNQKAASGPRLVKRIAIADPKPS